MRHGAVLCPRRPSTTGFKLVAAEALEKAITPKTKWPEGHELAVQPVRARPNTEAKLRALADVLLKHDHVWTLDQTTCTEQPHLWRIFQVQDPSAQEGVGASPDSTVR